MRVLIINKFLYPNGGSETYIFKLGEALEQHGHEVQYFGMEHEGRCVGNRVNAYTSGIGIYSYTANFANYFLMFAMLGMANYGARYIAQNRDDKQKLSYSFYSIYFCQCICTGLMIVLYTIYLLTICNVNLLASILQVMLIFSGFFDVSRNILLFDKGKVNIQ